MTAPIQTAEELVNSIIPSGNGWEYGDPVGRFIVVDRWPLVDRIRERDEAIRADALKGAASPPAAPPPDEAVKAAPEEIDDDLESKMRCIENYSLDRNDERVAWRAAIRAERERAFLEGQKQGARATLAMVVASSPETVRSVAGISMDEAIKDERAAADARVRAVVDGAWSCACLHGNDTQCSGWAAEFELWIKEHEPALAAELGAAGKEGA